MKTQERVFFSLDSFPCSTEVTISTTKHYVPNQSIKFLKEDLLGKSLNVDLNEGFNPDREEPDWTLWDGGWKHLLNSLLFLGKRLQAKSRKYNLKSVLEGAEVVCCRGAAANIASSVYDSNDSGFKLHVDKFNGVLFIKEVITEARLEETGRRNEWQKKTSWWGHKLETTLAGKGREYAAFLTKINANYKTREDEVKIFCVAEVDCRDSLENFVEIKAQANRLSYNDGKFQKKAMKWWIQSTLIGVEELVVGFRDNDGILFRADKVNLEDLRERCDDWDGQVCFQAVQHCFNQIRKQFDDLVGENQMLVLERKPLSRDIVYSVVPKIEILNKEFRDFFT
uniref:Decapping nuclease n=1 Tax=Panagrolaimus sp. JU765 TaxID=591449 RepID=A0AC34PVQ0_9BILA